jgi:hypothetical protein
VPDPVLECASSSRSEMEFSDTNRLSSQPQQTNDLLLQGPTAIFSGPNRVALLESLESLFENTVSPELWSVWWISDIKMLDEWLNLSGHCL